MLNFNDFKNRIGDRLKDLLEDKGYNVKIIYDDVRKTTGKYSGMSVILDADKKDTHIAPTFRLEELYEEYLNGTDINEIIDSVADCITKDVPQMLKHISLEDVSDYSYVKNKLFVITTSALTADDSIMVDSPYKQFEDIVLSYHILYDSNGGLSCSRVTNDLLSMMGVTAEELHRDAMANHQKMFPVTIKTMGEKMREMGAPEDLCRMIDSRTEAPLLVSNEHTFAGAAAMFFPDAMKRVEEKIGGSFYIVPDSIHDFTVIPENASVSLRSVTDLLQQINADGDIKTFLSDNVYHYDAGAKKLELATKYVERTQQKDGPNKGIDPRT